MNEITNERIPGLDFTIRDAFERAASRLDSVYILDVLNNHIIVIRAGDKAKTYTTKMVLNWDDEMDNIIDFFLASQYRAAARIMYSRVYVRRKFSNLDQFAQFAVERNDHTWTNISLIPVKIEKGECTCAMLTLVDITSSKKRNDQIVEQMKAVQQNIDYVNHLVLSVLEKEFYQAIKFDIISGETNRITFNDDKIKEYPLLNWIDYYDKIFENVHEDDKERLNESFRIDAIREMEPGDKRVVTYRANYENKKKYEWYRTSLTLSEFEPTVAIAFTRRVTAEVEEVTKILKSEKK